MGAIAPRGDLTAPLAVWARPGFARTGADVTDARPLAALGEV
jgi:hypothetical protein